MAKRGRSKRPIDEARAFGDLVELELKRTPSASLERVFQRIRRSGPKRWRKSDRTMYRLLADFKKDHTENPFRAELLAWMQRDDGAAPKLRERRPDTGRLDFED